MGVIEETGRAMVPLSFLPDPVTKPAVRPEPKPVSTTSGRTTQEFTGLSNNLQDFLVRRAFNFGVSTPKPPQPTTPTYPGAPLFSQGTGDADAVDYNDVNQGNFGDCYLMASLAAIARDDPQAIRNMVKENRDADGNLTSYTVTFQQKEGGFLGIGDHYEPVEVTVDPSEVLTDGANPADNGEIWVKVIEAAFAEHRGGVDKIKNGGNPSNTMEILTGNESRTYDTDPGWFGDSYSFDSLKTDFANGEEIVLSSRGNSKKHELAGYGVHGDHAYMVENVYTDSEGRQMVQLYNPWGHDHPKPIPFNEISKYFSEFGVN